MNYNQKTTFSENASPFEPPCNPILTCPHCGIDIIIIETNCGIFRCGLSKFTFAQINPHLSQIECEDLVKNNSIYGCGQPFQYIHGTLVKCAWI